ncbi:MAG: hypothetical protein LBR79_02690 [Oscillospiraceae bacterium]|nr:hypothetical protein [Oscillospiraceae bacterium]
MAGGKEGVLTILRHDPKSPRKYFYTPSSIWWWSKLIDNIFPPAFGGGGKRRDFNCFET